MSHLSTLVHGKDNITCGSLYLILLDIFFRSFHHNIPSIKEVYKWVAGPLLGEALDVHFHPKVRYYNIMHLYF